MDTPTYADVLTAAQRLQGRAVRTPLIYSPILSERLKARIFLKAECLQRTGSFKFRGAWNAVQALGRNAGAGIVACSSGNHAQGVAEAARLAELESVIVMPSDAPLPKRQRTERYGARVVLYDRAGEDREAIARRIAAEENFAFVHPYNDPTVIAGQGTVGLEIAEDLAAAGLAPDIVIVPCSGGGLSAGVALAIGERFPRARIYVAEPRDFDEYRRSLQAGAPQKNEKLTGSICDALLAPTPGAVGWEVNRGRLSGGVSASDEEALLAVGFAFDELRLVLEPSGAVALAALLCGRLDVVGGTAIVVLSGGNVGDDLLAEALRMHRTRAGALRPRPV
jgi:threonine dehydratase